jgi:hypothetical protein
MKPMVSQMVKDKPSQEITKGENRSTRCALGKIECERGNAACIRAELEKDAFPG